MGLGDSTSYRVRRSTGYSAVCVAEDSEGPGCRDL